MPTDIELAQQLKDGTYAGPRSTFAERKKARTVARSVAKSAREQERRDTEKEIEDAHARAMTRATRGIPIPLDGVVTFDVWAQLVVKLLKGVKPRTSEIERGFQGYYGREICDRLELTFDRYGKARARITFRGSQMVARCFLEVAVSKMGLKPTDATNRRYFDE